MTSSAVVGAFYPKTTYEDINNIQFSLVKNGAPVQIGNTSHMLWKVNELIAYVSTFFTLKKGDILFTGTPAGVGKISPGISLKVIYESEHVFSIDIK